MFVVQVWQFVRSWEIPQLQLIEFLDNVVDCPVVAQLQVPLSLRQRFSSCSRLIRCSTSFVQVLQFSCAELPQLLSLYSGLVVARLLYATTGKSVVDDLAQFIDGCGRPVLMLRREL